MSTYEEFVREYGKCLAKYYKKNFDGKPIFDALDNTFKEELIHLSQLNVKFLMIKEIAQTIQKEQDLPPSLSGMVETYIIGVEEINNTINEILEPLSEVLNVTIS